MYPHLLVAGFERKGNGYQWHASITHICGYLNTKLAITRPEKICHRFFYQTGSFWGRPVSWCHSNWPPTDACCMPWKREVSYLDIKFVITRLLWETSARFLYQSRGFGLSDNVMWCHSNGTWPTPVAAVTKFFACCHKSSASVKQRRATITLGFVTPSSKFGFCNELLRISDLFERSGSKLFKCLQHRNHWLSQLLPQSRPSVYDSGPRRH